MSGGMTMKPFGVSTKDEEMNQQGEMTPRLPHVDNMRKVLEDIVEVFRKNHGMKSGSITAQIASKEDESESDSDYGIEDGLKTEKGTGCSECDGKGCPECDKSMMPMWGSGVMGKLTKKV